MFQTEGIEKSEISGFCERQETTGKENGNVFVKL